MSKILLLLMILSMSASTWAQNIQERLLNGELALDVEPVDVSKIAYNIFGSPNKPWMILVHGLGGRKETWSNVVQDLSKDFHVLTIDQRSHGESVVYKENYSSSTMARDIVVLMDYLKIQKAHLVGHSMGGRTVVRFGAAYPERTLSITVEDMHLIGRKTLLPDFIPLMREAKKLYQPAFSSIDEFYKIYNPFFKLRTKRDFDLFGFVDKYTDRFIMKPNPFATEVYSNQALQEDLTDALKAVKSPITFLAAGEEDAVLFGKGLDHIKANKPEARVVAFNYASHSIHADEKKEFVREVIRGTKMGYISAKANRCQILF